MKMSTSEVKHGIRWTSMMRLDDLDFADDLAILTACTNPITIDGEDLEDVKTITYLGSIIVEHGSDADVKARIGKASAACSLLENI
ncbi:unnamed protein product [Schistosoma margrebowiei]|uniref:Uncharacterized protein n=1 Tax=Schistosoma margrebowiei TaxID=48269 RepID=A0A183N6E8_9TREM|nr:unnamed protein product [Schistosoma margrebowiei]